MDLQANQQEHAQDQEHARVMHELDAAGEQKAMGIDLNGKVMEGLFQVQKYKMDRASDAAALAHELRTSNLKHNTALRMSDLQVRTAERAAEAAGAKSRKNATARGLRK